jgi:long-chain acyl-CoA synthetase
MKVTRIFDLLDHYLENYSDNRVVLAGKVNHEWVTYDIYRYMEKVQLIAQAFIAKGVQPGDRIGIISGNRPEWNFFDMAVMRIGAVSVPIYPNISLTDYRYILDHAGIEYLYVDTSELVKRLQPVLSELPHFKELICLEETEGATLLDTFYEFGAAHPAADEIKQRMDAIRPEDMATIIYTSGTTGLQKGVMQSHRNILSQVEVLAPIPAPWNRTALSFLPMCHAYERILIYLYHYLGFSIWYAESLGTIAENIKEVNPTMMSCVPRVLEKMYDKLYLAGKKLPGLKKNLYYWAFNLAKQYDLENRNIWYRLQHLIADRLVYRQWRNAIGGHFDIVVSGGAAIQKQQAAFFNAIGMPVFEGYGLSETSPVIAVSTRGKGKRRPGTVGPPLPGVEVKIAENGEIICRGPNVMIGYYKDPELTAQVIDKDGWFHTGDTGKLTPDGLLMVTGRLKNIFKTSCGKYVNPFLIKEHF